jgi:putative heme iron utilization protein
MESNPHVSLLLTETDDLRADPQTLARISINGTAVLLPQTDTRYTGIKQTYLRRFPEAGQFFNLGDFNMWVITPASGRFVAGFGKAFNIVPDTLLKVSKL